jgi:hypothetical protein
MSLLAASDLNLAPILALGAVTITGLRMNGMLSDELVTELQKPFSRTTLLVVAALGAALTNLYWIAAHL